jgi:hypothetical protein
MAKRGWYDGITTSGSAPGFFIANDATLGKNVLYSSFSNTAQPDDNSALRHSLALSGSDITVWAAVKYHNLIATPGGSTCHHFYVGQGYSQYQAPAGVLTMYLEPGRQNSSDQDPITREWIDYSASFVFKFYTGQGWESQVGPNKTHIIQDDKWYEIRYYIKPGTSGHVRYDWKPYGGTWSTLYDANVNLGSRGAINQFLIGPYINEAQTTDQRMYVGFLKIYNGNAIPNIP